MSSPAISNGSDISEVRYLKERQAEDRAKIEKTEDKVGELALGLHGIKIEMRIWGGLMLALVSAVLVATVMKQ